MHIRELANGWRAGGMLRVGSPSDRPFAALRDMTVTLLGFLTIPSGEHNAWNFSLFYSPTGQIIFPIPGVAYVWRPTPQFQANLGIPFSLDYRPTETLTITASYRPLNNVQVLVRQSLGEAWSIYGGYRTVNDTFLLADRLDDQERTYLFDQRLTLGVQRELGRGWSLDLSAAYVFDRQIFQAEKFSGEPARRTGHRSGRGGHAPVAVDALRRSVKGARQEARYWFQSGFTREASPSTAGTFPPPRHRSAGARQTGPAAILRCCPRSTRPRGCGRAARATSSGPTVA